MTVRYYICQKLDISPVASRVSLGGDVWVETTRLVEHPTAITSGGVTISVREEFGPIYSKRAAVLMFDAKATPADIPPRHPGYPRRHLVPLNPDRWEIIERYEAGPTFDPDTVPPASVEPGAVGHWLFGASAVTLAGPKPEPVGEIWREQYHATIARGTGPAGYRLGVPYGRGTTFGGVFRVPELGNTAVCGEVLPGERGGYRFISTSHAGPLRLLAGFNRWRPEPELAEGLDGWFFLLASIDADDQMSVVVTVGGRHVVEQFGVPPERGPASYCLGPVYGEDIRGGGGLDVAEAFVWDRPMDEDEMRRVLDRSRARLAARGIDL